MAISEGALTARLRPLFIALATTALSAVLIGLPVAARAEAPDYRVTRLALEPSAIRHIDLINPIALAAVSWKGDATAASIRTRESSSWSAWRTLDIQSGDGPDGRESRTFTEPIWVGSAAAIEVQTPGGVTAAEISIVFQQGTIYLPVPDSASAVGAIPSYMSRASWGARPPKRTPTIAPSLKMAFIHHTAGTNDYGPGDGPSILRAIQAYHMDSRGWDDIGYNFLVDKYGQVYEGRAGGVDKAVVGAHAQGFNTGSTGVSVLGEFMDVAPTGSTLDAISRLLAWKLPASGIDPLATTVMTSGGSNKYPEGTQVEMYAISGHRDAGLTSCPGERLFSTLYDLRRLAAVGGAAFRPYPGFLGGEFVAAGNFDGGLDRLITGAGEGGGAQVRTFNATGTALTMFMAYPGFNGGVRVAAGKFDVTGPERIVTGAGPGGGPHVRTFNVDGTSGTGSFFAYPSGFRGGVYVAAGNVDAIPGDEIVTGAGPGGGPHVRVFKENATEVAGVFAYDQAFRGGVRVAAGDLDGDGQAEIVTGAGPGGGPHVRVWHLSPLGLQPVGSGFFAYPQGFSGGVYVGVARTSGGGLILTGAGEGGGLHFRAFRMDGTPVYSYFVMRPDVLTGLRIAAGHFDVRTTDDSLALGGGFGSISIARLTTLDGRLLPVGP